MKIIEYGTVYFRGPAGSIEGPRQIYDPMGVKADLFYLKKESLISEPNAVCGGGGSSIFDLTAESAFTDPDLGLRAVEVGVKQIGIIRLNRNL